jgi:hypothetical protein
MDLGENKWSWMCIFLHSSGTTSDVKKDEEVKRLPGGKVKKKVTFQVLKDQNYNYFKNYS